MESIAGYDAWKLQNGVDVNREEEIIRLEAGLARCLCDGHPFLYEESSDWSVVCESCVISVGGSSPDSAAKKWNTLFKRGDK